MVHGPSTMLVPLLLGISLCAVLAVQDCPENEFYNQETKQCQMCSTCDGQLLSRICSGTRDTMCGIVLARNFNFSFLDTKHSLSGSNKEQDTPTVIESDDDEEYWKNLAIALIAVVSVLAVVSTLVVMLDCYRYRKYNMTCKGATLEQGDVAESGYVVIHGFIPPGVTSSPSSVATGQVAQETHPFVSYHHRNNRSQAYKPKRRLMNEYVDEVFESDDSAGSRTLRLPTIPEKSDSDLTDSASSP